MKYRTIDLCAGIGGIRRGFELTGKFENVLSAEIDPYDCKTYEHLFGDNPLNDLTSESFKQKVSNTKYDILLAGFPCQAFSRAGLQMGFRDATRGTIFFDIADIISRSNPIAVFLENVDNLISHDSGKTLKRIIKTLEDELKYRIIGVLRDDEGNYVYSRDSLVRNSKFFGLPQNRPRLYLMAFSKEYYGDAIKLLSEHLPEKTDTVIAKDLYDILEDSVDDFYYMSSGYLETLRKHKIREHEKGNGFGYIVLNDEMPDHPIANTLLATGGSGKERNLIRQHKAGVAGKNVSSKKTQLNGEGIRVMTPTEWGRLQGFIGYAFVDENGIDHFNFPEGTTRGQQFKQFGNSVTIPVIEAMANHMIHCFEVMNGSQIKEIIQMVESAEYITVSDVIDRLRVTTNRAKVLLDTAKKQKLIEKVSTRGRYKKKAQK